MIVLLECMICGNWAVNITQINLQQDKVATVEPGDIPQVDLCELVRNPEKYDKKIVRVKAVLVGSHAVVVDGGEDYLYSPSCSERESAIFVTAHKTRQKDDPDVSKSIQEFQKKRDKHGISRVWITFTGLFERATGSGFGHLSWAQFQIATFKIEKAEKFKGK
jgi:hypothetical protein